MAINYTLYVNQVANLSLTAPTSNPLSDANFSTMLPGAIDYAEQRIYRELDLLNTYVTDTTASFPVQSRVFTLPLSQGTFLIVDELSAISPANTSVANGTRNQLLFTSKQFIDACYPSDLSGNGIPRFAHRLNDTQILVGPAPDAGYQAEVIGTQRPAPLTSLNSSTFLTKVLPDLFIAATMVFVSAYMRDWSQTSDNPQMGPSWEGQYKTLMQSANVEEVRKKYRGQGWSAEQPAQITTPPRV